MTPFEIALAVAATFFGVGDIILIYFLVAQGAVIDKLRFSLRTRGETILELHALLSKAKKKDRPVTGSRRFVKGE